MKKRFSDEQIISILREAEAGVSARELCRKHPISDATFYTWRKKCGGMAVWGAARDPARCKAGKSFCDYRASLPAWASRVPGGTRNAPGGRLSHGCVAAVRCRQRPQNDIETSCGWPAAQKRPVSHWLRSGLANPWPIRAGMSASALFYQHVLRHRLATLRSATCLFSLRFSSSSCRICFSPEGEMPPYFYAKYRKWHSKCLACDRRPALT